jgi:hypothetical protein
MSEMKVDSSKKPSLLGLISNPSEQFERLRERPLVAVPLIIVFLMMMAGTVLTLAGTDFVAQFGAVGDPLGDRQMAVTIGWTVGIILALIYIFGLFFLGALIYWICAKIAGSSVKYKHMLSLNIFILFISSIGMIINGLVIFFTNVDPTSNVTSLKSIIPAEEPVASILNTFEIFSICGYILLAIGYQKVAGLSKKASWTITIILFAILLILSLLSGIYQSLMGQFEGAV